MSDRQIFQLIADGLLILHTLFIGFVVFGLVFIVIGIYRKWTWIRNAWFRSVHLAAIGVVVLQAWLGVICPLTVWEQYFREKAGQSGYDGSFIQYWLHRLIFYEAELWVFTLLYTVFGGAVLLTWIIAPPSLKKRNRVNSD